MTPASPIRPRDLVDAWRSAHWPPPLRQLGVDLPVYAGSHALVSEWAQPLMEVMSAVSDHVGDLENGGRPPRWMRVPKLLFGVTRINLVQATAKASRRFECLEKLLHRCGSLPPESVAKVSAWLEENPGRGLVAHAAFEDLRAYVWQIGNPRASRVRFYLSGAVLATAPGVDLVVQDHRRTVRNSRADAYRDPLASTSQGWTVFAAPLKKPRRARRGAREKGDGG